MEGKKFRLRAKNLFLTYPKCPLSHEDIIEELKKKPELHIKEWLVGREHHQDGELHLHVLLELDETLETKRCTLLDVKGFHGNYQATRSVPKSIKYICKEGDYVGSYTRDYIEGYLKKDKSFLAQKFLDAENLIEIVKDNPELLFNYKKIKENVEEFKQDLRFQTSQSDMGDELDNTVGLRLLVDTDNKKCHYWIWSSTPNKGKTTGILLPISKMPHAYIMDVQSVYHDVNPDTRIICIDEFARGQMKAQMLNKICDGTFSFRVFHKGNIKLRSKPIVVVCSNFSIKDVFPQMFETIERRFNEMNLD